MINNKKGSLWGKWDLHFHSPSSFEYEDKSVTDQSIIDTLVKNNVIAVAITDHHFIDTARIKSLRQLGNDKITIFPGIELCSELGGSELMHFIGLFPEDSDIVHIWKIIEVSCHITEKEIKERGGHENLFVDFKEATDIIHKNGGLVSVHAGKKSNSIEHLKNKIKDDIEYNKCIDILEVGKKADIDDYLKIVFPDIGRKIPIVVSSDNHNIKNYNSNSNNILWIKADTTFNGLRQITFEPDSRIFIGDIPEIIERVKSSPTKFIKEIKINKNKDSKLSEKWFENINISFNYELTAIIGNKGSGKSAILDSIGLLGNSKNHKEFSFLNGEKFNKLPQNRGKNYTAELEWVKGDPANRTLYEYPKSSDLENVKCIPQKYLENLCTNISEEKEDEFQKELKDVIFSHVPYQDRLNKNSLKELEDYLVEQIKKDIINLQYKLKLLNEKIINLEIKNTENYKKIVTDKKDKKEIELISLKEPTKVQEPDKSKKTPELIKYITDLDEKKKQIKELEDKLKEFIEKSTKININIADLTNAKKSFDSLKKEFNDVKNLHKTVLLDFGINIDDIISLKYESKLITDKITSLKSELAKYNEEMDLKKDNSYANKIENLKVDIAKIKEKLDAPTIIFEKYKESLKEYEEKKKAIQGSKIKDGTLEYYKNELLYLENNLLKDIQSLRNDRINIVKDILNKKDEITKAYSQLYEPVAKFISTHKTVDKEYQIRFDVSLSFKDFDDKFLNYILKNVIGSFRENELAAEKLKEIKSKVDINNPVTIIDFLNNIIYNLENDTRVKDDPQKNEITKQIKEKDLLSFYDFLFGLEYLEPDYKLMLGNKLLTELSPGEKGALLLIFYLLIDQDDSPLLIDQPEENLDNESVYKILVEYIRVAKKRRQIIIVTHNPNLAVVCDAEQIISVNIDKKDGNKFSFKSGSIENLEINKDIIRILEGTLPAFNLRDKKYTISKRLGL